MGALPAGSLSGNRGGGIGGSAFTRPGRWPQNRLAAFRSICGAGRSLRSSGPFALAPAGLFAAVRLFYPEQFSYRPFNNHETTPWLWTKPPANADNKPAKPIPAPPLFIQSALRMPLPGPLPANYPALQAGTIAKLQRQHV